MTDTCNMKLKIFVPGKRNQTQKSTHCVINSMYVKFYYRQKECTVTESRSVGAWACVGVEGLDCKKCKGLFVVYENAPYFVYGDGYYRYNQKTSQQFSFLKSLRLLFFKYCGIHYHNDVQDPLRKTKVPKGIQFLEFRHDLLCIFKQNIFSEYNSI